MIKIYELEKLEGLSDTGLAATPTDVGMPYIVMRVGTGFFTGFRKASGAFIIRDCASV